MTTCLFFRFHYNNRVIRGSYATLYTIIRSPVNTHFIFFSPPWQFHNKGSGFIQFHVVSDKSSNYTINQTSCKRKWMFKAGHNEVEWFIRSVISDLSGFFFLGVFCSSVLISALSPAPLTFRTDQATVVPYRAEVLKHKDSHGHHCQAHHKHHHPHSRAVGLCHKEGGQKVSNHKTIWNQNIIYYLYADDVIEGSPILQITQGTY